VALLQTKPSTPRLSDAARHLVIPSGIVTTGWPQVIAKGDDLGIGFDWWQDSLGRAVLGKRADGKYAATVGGVVLSIPRQVGKTYFVGALLVILCVLNPGLKVIWTAHRTRTATNTFRSLQAMAKRAKVDPHVSHIRTANGEQEIGFRNGSIIMFGAREQGFGRGFDELDVEVFDEAQILTEKALEDIVPAANQSRQPTGALLFFMGTPPRPVDPGEEFTNRRSKALSGKADNMVYAEFSADPDADPDDRDQWAKANPSFPLRTPVESMERMREQLTDEASFKREGLGIWDAAQGTGVIPAPSWADAQDEHSIAGDRFALGIECGPDLAYAAVSLAGQRPDGDWHFELDEDQHTRGAGVAWLIPHVQKLTAANPQIRAVVVDVFGPIKALLEQRATDGRWFFKGTKLEVTPVKVNELGVACSRVLNGIVTGDLHHIGQPQFSSAALSAGKRPLGDTGMWVWSRKLATSDITPIQAATLALAGAQNTTVKRPSHSGRGRVATVL
jgi:phage terminase large subunit-like protein